MSASFRFLIGHPTENMKEGFIGGSPLKFLEDSNDSTSQVYSTIMKQSLAHDC